MVAREDLLNEVWGHNALSVSGVAQAIREIRRALGDDASRPHYIGTRHGYGYQLLVQPRGLDDDAGALAESDKKTHWRQLRTPVDPTISLGALTFLLVGIALGVFWPDLESTTANPDQANEPSGLYSRAGPAEPEARSAHRSGREFMVRFEWVEAIERLEHASRLAPDSVPVVLDLIRAYFLAGYETRARELTFHPALQQKRLSRRERLELHAITALANGNPASAAGSLRSLADFFPEEIDYLRLLFEAELRSAPAARASVILDRIRAASPDEQNGIPQLIARHALESRQRELDEALAAAELAVERAGSGNSGPLHARSLYARGRTLTELGDFARAKEDLEQASEIFSRFHDAPGHAATMLAIAELELARMRPENAERALRAGCTLSERAGFQFGRATCSRVLGDMLSAESDFEGALEHYADAQRRFKSSGRIREHAEVLVRTGRAFLKSEDLESARERFEAADELYAGLNDRAGYAQVRQGLGIIDEQTGDIEAAESNLGAALVLFAAVGDRQGEADTASRLVHLMHMAGRHERESELASRAATLYRSLDDPDAEARTLVNLAEMEKRHGQLDEAIRLLNDAATLFERVSDPGMTMRVLALQARIHLSSAEMEQARAVLERAGRLDGADVLQQSELASARGARALLAWDPESAEYLFNRAREMRLEAGAESRARSSDRDLARLLIERGELTKAELLLREVESSLDTMDSFDDRAETCILLASALVAQGKLEAADHKLQTLTGMDLAGYDMMLDLQYRALAARAGSIETAETELMRVRDEAIDHGFRLFAMEIDATLAVTRAQRDPASSALAQLDAVITDARDAGVHCVAERLSELDRSRSPRQSPGKNSRISTSVTQGSPLP